MYSIYNIRDDLFEIIYIIRDDVFEIMSIIRDDVFEIIFDDAYYVLWLIQFFLLIDCIHAL